MSRKISSKRDESHHSSRRGKNLLLSLSLVPFIIGMLLIGAWVLDIDVFDEPQQNVTVGILFMLLSFTLSNIFQKRWVLAGGWGLLMCADIIVLAWPHVWAQAVAIAVGLVGLVFLGIEFYRQYRVNQQKKTKK